MWNDTLLVFTEKSFSTGNLCFSSENRLTHLKKEEKKNHIYRILTGMCACINKTKSKAYNKHMRGRSTHGYLKKTFNVMQKFKANFNHDKDNDDPLQPC